MSSKQAHIFSNILQCADRSPLNNKHAAALYAGGKIITMNHNSYRTKIGREIHCSIHSEIACLYRLCPHAFCMKKFNTRGKMRRKFNKITLYSIKQCPTDKTTKDSSPCEHCVRKIKQLGIKKIVYIDGGGTIKKIKAANFTTKYISAGYREYYSQNIKID